MTKVKAKATRKESIQLSTYPRVPVDEPDVRVLRSFVAERADARRYRSGKSVIEKSALPW